MILYSKETIKNYLKKFNNTNQIVRIKQLYESLSKNIKLYS